MPKYNDKYHESESEFLVAVCKQRMFRSDIANTRGLPKSDVPQIEDEENFGDESQQTVHYNEQPSHLSVDRDFIDPSTYGKLPIILLDLETSGFRGDCDILQIAAKCGTNMFETYINPTQQISLFASEANGLTNFNGVLMHYGEPVPSIPLRVALMNLHSWLKSFGKGCYIATHNFSFDGPRLINAISSCSLRNDFREVIYGFIDTLRIIRKKTGRRVKGECTIEGLAKWLNVSSAGAHNAVNDVKILDKILERAEITSDLLIDSAESYSERIDKWDGDKYVKERLPVLDPLKDIVGLTIRKKMVKASITIEHLMHVYRNSGPGGITALLSSGVDGKPVVTNHKSTLMKIISWIEMNSELLPDIKHQI